MWILSRTLFQHVLLCNYKNRGYYMTARRYEIPLRVSAANE